MVYNPKVIDFFKRHNMYDEKMFNYLENNSVMVDYNDPDQRMFIGFSAQVKDGILRKFTICIPYVQDNITMLNNIHEITHGIYAYRRLNKKYKTLAIEVMPFVFEKMFVEEMQDEELNKYSNYLDSLIDDKSEDKYKLALKLRDSLIESFNGDYDEIERKSDREVNHEEIKLKLSRFLKS